MKHIKLEPKNSQLLSIPDFFIRMGWYAFFGCLFLACSLGIGTVGYHFTANLGWVDAFLNASMILTGMGPVDKLETLTAKLFASFYAIFDLQWGGFSDLLRSSIHPNLSSVYSQVSSRFGGKEPLRLLCNIASTYLPN